MWVGLPAEPLDEESVACSSVCVPKSVSSSLAVSFLTLITSWIADLGSVSEHN
jgi:hypothetical protein